MVLNASTQACTTGCKRTCAGRAQIAPPAFEDGSGQILVQEIVVRGTASVKTVRPQVQVVERENLHCLWKEGAQADGASKVDQVHGPLHFEGRGGGR